jgi:hypothetical protein
LRLPTSRLVDRRPLIERRVTATLSPLKSSGDPYPTYSVTWLPKGDGPSPEFAGALAVEKTARDGYFGLIVSGRCEPSGTFDAIFDATHGRRIACVGARGLLRSIAGYVESARTHNEAAHAGHSPLKYLTRVGAPSKSLPALP